MKTTAIKKEFKDLSLEKLIQKKSQISMFLIDNQNLERAEQGYITITVLDRLIRAKEREDELMEEVTKELFFE